MLAQSPRFFYRFYSTKLRKYLRKNKLKKRLDLAWFVNCKIIRARFAPLPTGNCEIERPNNEDPFDAITNY